MITLNRLFTLLLSSLALLVMGSCLGAQTATHERTGAPVDGLHNAAGGYTETCADLPGLIGDDC